MMASKTINASKVDSSHTDIFSSQKNYDINLTNKIINHKENLKRRVSKNKSKF